MELQITDSEKTDVFCSMFQHTKVMCDFITLHFSPEQLFFQAMDASHVSILELRIPSEWFDSYSLSGSSSAEGEEEEGEEECTKKVVGTTNCDISINSSIFFKILDSRDKMQTLTIVYDRESSDKLKIIFQSPSNSSSSKKATAAVADEKPAASRKQPLRQVDNSANIFDKEFCIPLVDMTSDLMNIPEGTSYDAEISLPSSNFANNVNRMMVFADTMEIQCSQKQVSFYSSSVETGDMRVIIHNEEGEEEEEEEEVLKLSFSLRNLHNICLYHKIAKEIVLNMKCGFPMKAVYDLGRGVSIVFYLAPKIDEE